MFRLIKLIFISIFLLETSIGFCGYADKVLKDVTSYDTGALNTRLTNQDTKVYLTNQDTHVTIADIVFTSDSQTKNVVYGYTYRETTVACTVTIPMSCVSYWIAVDSGTTGATITYHINNSGYVGEDVTLKSSETEGDEFKPFATSVQIVITYVAPGNVTRFKFSGVR